MVEVQPAVTGQNGPLPKNDKILNLFWDLSSLEAEVQVKAAQELVAETMEVQNSQPPVDKEAMASAEDAEALLAPFSQSTAYVIKRLIRGLGSGRAGARQGFALALTLLLAELQSFSAGQTSNLIFTFLEAVGNKGADTRDYLLGRIFGLAAVVRSGIQCSTVEAAEILDQLIDAGSKKSFLREISTAAVLDVLKSRKSSDIVDVVAASKKVPDLLNQPLKSMTVETVLLALNLWPYLTQNVADKCPALPSGSAKPDAGSLDGGTTASTAKRVHSSSKNTNSASRSFFTTNHMEALGPILATSTANHPVRHGIWDVLLTFVSGGAPPPNPIPDENAAALSTFWTTVVERQLLAFNSEARKYLGFALLQDLLPRLTVATAGSVLSPATLRELNRHLGPRRTNLSKMALKCKESILAELKKAQERDAATFMAMKSCLQKAGGSLWKATRLEEGVAGETPSDSAALESLAHNRTEALLAALSRQPSEENMGEPDPAAASAIEALWDILKRSRSTELSVGILKLFAALGLLRSKADAAAKKKKKKKGNQDDDDKALEALSQCDHDALSLVRTVLISRLISGLDMVCRRSTRSRQETSNGAAMDTASALVQWIANALDAGAAELAQPEQGSALAARALGSTLDAISEEKADEIKRSRWLAAIRLLSSMAQIYSWADGSLVEAETLGDLASVTEHVFAGEQDTQPPQKKKRKESDEGHDAPVWNDTLVDVLLSFLAKNCTPLPSAPLRDAADALFRASCNDLTAMGLQDMLAVLTSRAGGVLGADEEAEEEESEEEDSEEESDDASSSEEEEDNAAEDGESDEEEEEEETADDDSASSSSDDDDEFAATDEDMFRMDAKLAAYFATLKRGKGSAKEADEQLVQFKLRVINVLEQLFKRAPSSPLLPLAAVPLLNALCMSVTSTGSAVLAKRLESLIDQGLAKSKAAASGLGGFESMDDLTAAFERVLRLASRHSNTSVQSAATIVFSYLQRAASKAPTELQAVANGAIVRAVHFILCSRKGHLRHKFILTVLERAPASAPSMVSAVFEMLPGARNGDFIRVEAALILQAALKAGSKEAIEAFTGHASQARDFFVTCCDSTAFKQRGRQTEALRVLLRVVQACKGSETGIDWAVIREKAEESVAREDVQVSKNLVSALHAVIEAIPTQDSNKKKTSSKKRKTA